MVEGGDDELVYELTFDLPDAGLGSTQGNPPMIFSDDRNDNTPITIAEDTEDSPSNGRWSTFSDTSSQECGRQSTIQHAAESPCTRTRCPSHPHQGATHNFSTSRNGASTQECSGGKQTGKNNEGRATSGNNDYDIRTFCG